MEDGYINLIIRPDGRFEEALVVRKGQHEALASGRLLRLLNTVQPQVDALAQAARMAALCQFVEDLE